MSPGSTIATLMISADHPAASVLRDTPIGELITVSGVIIGGVARPEVLVQTAIRFMPTPTAPPPTTQYSDCVFNCPCLDPRGQHGLLARAVTKSC